MGLSPGSQVTRWPTSWLGTRSTPCLEQTKSDEIKKFSAHVELKMAECGSLFLNS